MSPKSMKSLLITLATAIFVAAAWWMIGPLTDQASEGDEIGGVPRVETHALSTQQNSAESAGAALASVNGAVEVSSQPAAVEPQRGEEFPGSSGIWVLVHDDDTDETISGATVISLDPDSLPPKIRRRLDSEWDGSTEMIVKEYGQRFISGERGLVRIPRHGEDQLIFGEWKGKRDLESRGQLNKTWLRLHKQSRLEVLVVDERGAPVPNFPVAVQRRTDSDYRTQGVSWTNANGIAAIATPPKESMESDWNGHLCVATAVFGQKLSDAPDAWTRIRPHHLEKGRIQLIKPPTGGLWLESIDLEPTGLERGSGSRLKLELESKDHSFLFGTAWNDLDVIQTDLQRMEYVALGLRFRAEHGYQEWVFDGPIVPDEWTHVELELDPEVVWSGVLLGLDGKPVGKGRLRIVEVAVGGGQTEKRIKHAETDAAGAFQVADLIAQINDSRLDDSQVQRSLGLVWWDSKKESLVAQLDWDPASPTQLGKIQLERMPVVLSGTIHDQDGRPVPDAVFGVRCAQGEGWIPGQRMVLDGSTTKIDQDGNFEIQTYGPVNSAYTLRASADGHQSQYGISTRIGAPVAIIIQEIPPDSGRVIGSIQIEPWAEESQFKFKHGSPSDPEYFNLPVHPAENGSYSFGVTVKPEEEVVVVIKTRIGETIYQSEVLQPVRGETIDLGQVATADGLQPLVNWVIENEDGLQVLAEVHVATDDFQGKAYPQNGKVSLRTVSPIRRAVVVATGYQSQEILAPERSQTVVLKAKRN
jgi:hypothetical protein